MNEFLLLLAFLASPALILASIALASWLLFFAPDEKFRPESTFKILLDIGGGTINKNLPALYFLVSELCFVFCAVIGILSVTETWGFSVPGGGLIAQAINFGVGLVFYDAVCEEVATVRGHQLAQKAYNTPVFVGQ
ncbi:MAG: hypothetical protein AAB536_01370 [Patescibacteria group bacterium]